MAENSKIEWTDATGRALGVLKVAAQRVGLPFDEYLARRQSGQKHCRACKGWLDKDAFAADAHRGDGRAAVCRACASRIAKARHQPVPRHLRKRMGPPPKPARDGDKAQARHRVNVMVRSGRLPSPSSLPCADCGHTHHPGSRRHEYDHHLGYGAEQHLSVEAGS